MAVWIDLQAELTIVSTSQTKHLIPCFQYEFDIQQYSTLQEANVEVVIHNVEGDEKIDIIMM